MRVLVCGGRNFGDLGSVKREDPLWASREAEYLFVMKTLGDIVYDRTGTPNDTKMLPECTIIQGGARGADSCAADWAVVNWTGFEEYQADWIKHGKAAGHIRNKQMLEEGKPDLVIAFPGGRGTAHMVRIAKEAGVEVIEVTYDPT
jgi:hypothetical protein